MKEGPEGTVRGPVQMRRLRSETPGASKVRRLYQCEGLSPRAPWSWGTRPTEEGIFQIPNKPGIN